MGIWKIAGGTVYDPAHGVDGQPRDLWIEGSQIIAEPPAGTKAERTLDATGYVVFPGGVDMHSHIAGPKVNIARKMRPEGRTPLTRSQFPRSGTIGSLPSTTATGYLYSGMGYSTVVDAAVPPLSAKQAHLEFADTPLLDAAMFLLFGNNHFVMEHISRNEPELTDAYVAWVLAAGKGLGMKLVNPGGVEEWKANQRRTVTSIDEEVSGFRITPRQIIRELAATADRLNLPHPVHIHANNLGLAGNWTTTRDTIAALEGHRAHFAHIQFHSYHGGADDEKSFGSAVPELVELIAARPEISVDVGCVLFGPTTAITGDGPVGRYLHHLLGGRWFSSDSECECGCGVVPVHYKDKSLVHAIQWATGLEWYLLMPDPWRIALTTDHPNGGVFWRYPELIRLLMDRAYRRECVDLLPEKIRARTVLADLDREYTLSEIAIITRAAPAKLLGLAHKGHLGPGADADLVLYSPSDDKEAMFARPRHVIKAGRHLFDDGTFVGDERDLVTGRTYCVDQPESFEPYEYLNNWFKRHYTIELANYPVPSSDRMIRVGDGGTRR